ncbi:hypothetical protein YWIDRAFT_06335 [Streptomyces sp. SceaMP-e96]|nr:hypothetical protein [Streptomyces sp. SID4951]SCK34994.1 hypothetical protein YWIDRAFT_06335 [Streptomyces sp. SceaMP-e96]
MPDRFAARQGHEHRRPPWSDSRLLHPFRRHAGEAPSSPDHVIVRLPRKVTIENAERIATHAGPQVRGTLRQLGLSCAIDVYEASGPPTA